MRFSTHIKFHCQFLCRFPWKRSFLDILPQKYAKYKVKQECGPWLGYVTDKSSYSFLSQKRWRDQWMQEQDRVRRGKLWLAENVHVTCILASDWSIEAGAGQSRAGEALKVLLVAAAEKYWGPTQISLQKQPSWVWRAASAGSGAYSVDGLLLHKLTPLTGQRNSVYFNQLFHGEGAR